MTKRTRHTRSSRHESTLSYGGKWFRDRYHSDPEYKKKHRERQKKWYSSEKGKAFLKKQRAKKYGITVEFLDSLGDVCSVCGGDGRNSRGTIHIDHDHNTGEVRGVLCMRCNQALGLLLDDVNILRAAIDYLEGNNE